MKRFFVFVCLLAACTAAWSQSKMTPELLWQLSRVSSPQLSKDGKSVIYTVSIPRVAENKSTSKRFVLPVEGGSPVELTGTVFSDKAISPDGKLTLKVQEVKVGN